MRRVSVGFLLLVMLTLIGPTGCNLTRDEDETKTTPTTRDVSHNLTATPTQLPPIFATVTSTPTIFIQVTPTEEVISPFRPQDCPIPFGWQPYQVSEGDTLGTLANTIGSNITTLQSGNCLVDANIIVVNDIIYLPSLPPLPSPTPTTFFFATPTPTTGAALAGNPPEFIEDLSVLPTQAQTGDRYITAQRTIALNAGIVPDANLVRYIAQFSDGSRVEITADYDPFDGTRVFYNIPNSETELYITAIAENEFGSAASNTLHIIYNPETAYQPGKPRIQPFAGYDFNSQVFAIRANSTINLIWDEAPINATSVEFLLETVGSDEVQLLGMTNNVQNGATISWYVQENFRGEIYAKATMPDGQITYSATIFVSATGG